MRTFINTVGIVIIIMVILSFAMENTVPVVIKYYELSFSAPVWALIFIPFFLGVIGGNLLDVIQRFRLRNEIRKLKQEFKKMNPEDPQQ